MVQGGGRTKHLLEALLLLNRYHEPIQRFYDTETDRLQLVRFYLRTKKWKARQIEQDLVDDGVIKPRKNKQRGSSAAASAAAGSETEASASDHEDDVGQESGNGTLARSHVGRARASLRAMSGRMLVTLVERWLTVYTCVVPPPSVCRPHGRSRRRCRSRWRRCWFQQSGPGG